MSRLLVALDVALLVLLLWPLWPVKPSTRPSSDTGPPLDAVERRPATVTAPEPRPGPVPVPDTAPEQRGPLLVSQVAWALDAVALAMEAGLGVVEAVEATAAVSEPTVQQALRVVAAAYRWGCPADVAWAAAGPCWAATGQLLAGSHEAGSAASALLRDSAQAWREAENHRAALAAGRLSVQVVLPTGLAFLTGFVLTALVPVVVAIAGGLL